MINKRIIEIDLLRSLAVVLMVIFHFIYDLDTFTDLNISFRDPLWYYIGRVSAFSFMFVSGVSSGFSHHPAKNGLRIFVYGLGITLVTFIFLREEYVRFGILHFLGVSMMLYPLLSALPRFTLVPLALFSFGIGIVFKNMSVETAWLLPFGLTYPGFATIDYYPIFPYIGMPILGIFFYKTFYIHGKGLLDSWLIPLFNRKKLRFLNMTSHHSLGIYLIHQLILISLIFLVQAIIRQLF